MKIQAPGNEKHRQPNFQQPTSKPKNRFTAEASQESRLDKLI